MPSLFCILQAAGIVVGICVYTATIIIAIVEVDERNRGGTFMYACRVWLGLNVALFFGGFIFAIAQSLCK